MFTAHFKMTDHPFMENPPVEWLLNDDRFDRALARLRFFQEQGNLALIVGQSGVGKSSLLRLFRQRMPQNRYGHVCFHLTSVTPIALLRSIVAGIGESPKLGKDRLFNQIIDRVGKSETETVLIIDEAHLIPSQSLTDLRLLVSSGMDNDLPLKILLCGQESISHTLKRSALTDLVHRICVRYRMSSLTASQTAVYIEHRLRCADASEKLFEPEAKAVIHDYSGGVPRQINNIATACLINAASKNFQKVDENLVNETMAEFRLP
ncbi:MAG: AAA family ATPase [Desulfobacteraceae bacterium]|nr:AAA family ATPase [Desulfobacteraceae bacterium]